MRPDRERDAAGVVILPVTLHVIPKPPRVLDKIGRKAWRFMARQRLEAKCLTATDVPRLERYALGYQQWTHAEATLKRDGYFIAGKNGRVRFHPAAKVSNLAYLEMLVWGLALKHVRQSGGDLPRGA